MPYLGNIPATQFAELKYQDFTGGTGTSFTLNDPVGSAQELEVFVNNVRQEPGVAYTVSGTALTMTGSIVATDDFYVVFQGKSTGTATHPAGQALTATDGTFTGDLTVDTNTLYVDAANNRVGVGSASPEHKLSVFEDSSGNRTEIGIDNLDQRLVLGAFYQGGVGQYSTIQSTNSAESSDEALVLQPDGGNVGIGTSSPSFPISVQKANGTYTDFETVFDGSISGGGGESALSLSVQGDALGAYVSSNLTFSDNVASQSNASRASSFIKFGNATSGSHGTISFGGTGVGSTTEVESMRIKSDGEVNIGGGSDSFTEAHLNVYNNGGTSNGWGGAALTVYGPYGGGLSFVDSGTNPADGDNGYKMHTVDGGNDFYIRGTTSKTASSGGVYLNDFATSWSSASDERQKENIVNITGALDDVATLRAVKANYIWSDTTRAFLIAQDVQAVLPEAVSIQNKEAEEAEQRLGIDYYQVVPLLVAALKEAKTKIETLETENSTQATQIADLITRVTALEDA